MFFAVSSTFDHLANPDLHFLATGQNPVSDWHPFEP